MEVKPLVYLNPYDFYTLRIDVKPLEQYVKEITDVIMGTGEYNDEARKLIFGFRATINDKLSNVVCDFNNNIFYIQSNYFEYKIKMHRTNISDKWFFKGLSRSKGFLVPFGKIEKDLCIGENTIYFFFKEYINNVDVVGNDFNYNGMVWLEDRFDTSLRYYREAKATNSLTAAVIYSHDFEKSFIMPSGSHTKWKEIKVTSHRYTLSRYQYRLDNVIREIKITLFGQPAFCELTPKTGPSISFNDNHQVTVTFKFTLHDNEFDYIAANGHIHYYTFIAKLMEKLQLAEANSDRKYIEHVCNKIVEMDEYLTGEGLHSCPIAVNPKELMNLFEVV